MPEMVIEFRLKYVILDRDIKEWYDNIKAD